jgi:hypothetical protein
VCAAINNCLDELAIAYVLCCSCEQLSSPGLPPQEAPVMIAEKRKLFLLFLSSSATFSIACFRNDSCGHHTQYEDCSCLLFLYVLPLPSVRRLCHHPSQHAWLVVRSLPSHVVSPSDVVAQPCRKCTLDNTHQCVNDTAVVAILLIPDKCILKMAESTCT